MTRWFRVEVQNIVRDCLLYMTKARQFKSKAQKDIKFPATLWTDEYVRQSLGGIQRLSIQGEGNEQLKICYR